jgi:hypothetical protein
MEIRWGIFIGQGVVIVVVEVLGQAYVHALVLQSGSLIKCNAECNEGNVWKVLTSH